MSYFDIYESRGHGMYPEGIPLDGDEFVTPEDTEVGMDVNNPKFDKRVELALQKSRAIFVVNSVSGKKLGQIINFDSRYERRVPEEDESLKDEDNRQGDEDMLITRSISPTLIGPAPEDRIGESKDVIIGDEQSIQDSGISDIEVKNGNGDTMAAAGPDVIAGDPGASAAPVEKKFPFMTVAVAAGLGFLLLKMLKK